MAEAGWWPLRGREHGNDRAKRMSATTAVRFQALPPLSPDEYVALEKSILALGVMVPILVDDHDVVIDGHHRQKIAAHHNLHCPVEKKRGLSDAAKRTLALSLNLDRRHLTREQRRALVEESIKADPQLSDREHGRRTGVSPQTATKVRDELEESAQVEHFPERIDPRTGNASQSASKPPRRQTKPSDQQCADCEEGGLESIGPEPQTADWHRRVETISYELGEVVEQLNAEELDLTLGAAEFLFHMLKGETHQRKHRKGK